MKRLLIFWVVALSILYATLSVARHNRFQSGGFDLGLYDQAVWQYSQFIWPYNTVKERFILGDHLSLTLPLVAPLFWIWEDARILLIFQAVWVSLSVLAVYKLALLRKFSPFISFCVSFVYSLFYGIQYGIFFDFHPVLLAVGLIPWMLYFLESKNTKLFVLCAILLVLTQENMGLTLAGIGFVYFFQKPFRKTAIVCVIGGIASSIAAAKIIAIISPTGFQYTPQLTLNPILFVQDLFNAPEKQTAWLYTMSAFSFLPIFSPGAMLAIVSDLAQYYTTGPEFARMWSPLMHHRASLAPFVLLGALDALTLFRKRKFRVELIAVFLILSALAQQYIFHYPLNKLSKAEFWRVESWMQDNREMISTIPGDISIATQQSLVPHLSHRKEIYIAWPRLHDFDERPCGQTSCWWLDFNTNAQYLLIDTHPNIWLTMLLETPERVNGALTNMEKLGRISLVQKINDVRLYRVNKN